MNSDCVTLSHFQSSYDTGHLYENEVTLWNMDQTTFNLWSTILQCLATAVSAGVAVVVYRYTKETSRIREQGQEQLQIMQQQLQLGLAPFLIARVTGYAPEGQNVPHTAVADTRASHVCLIHNPTDRPAHHINILLYSGGGRYFWSPEVLDVLGQENRALAARGPLSREAVVREIHREYKEDAKAYLHIVQEGRGFLAIFFRDINGNLYVATRFVDFDGPGTTPVAHWTNQVLRPFGTRAGE